MHLDWLLSLAGLIVGFTVGLTGMGGGALMTPVLVLLFHVQPLAAVSSDLVASMIMKPVGAAVHARRGTVHRALVLWLVVGSVPTAFAGVFVLRHLGQGDQVQDRIKLALGVALLVAATAIVLKSRAADRNEARPRSDEPVRVRRVPTVLVGALGGLVVGMTSVGSGSLIIVLVPMGSAGAKAMAVVQGRADVYVHAGGQYEWDSAAPVAVARAAGLHASRIDGSPLRYNQPDLLLPDVLICPVSVRDRVLATLAEV